jgi:tRNA(Ile)-lysidine synthase
MLPLQKFTEFVEQNALFTPHDKILLAVSGGKDSVLMVQLFKLAGYNFSISHCNFNLRGDEAQRDEVFVKLLAKNVDVDFHLTHFDTKQYAEENRISTQMAARDLRYQWFEQVRQEGNYNYIALAHHQNDAIETLLINLVRGTGISGMHGILPKRNKLVRPLLFLSRQQIDDIVRENNIDFVEDSSNQTTKYARNKVRLNVIPQLREINPNLEETFAQNITRFSETEEVVQQYVAEIKSKIFKEAEGDIFINIEQIKMLKPQNLLFFELLKSFSFTASVVSEILTSLDKQSGTSFYSKTHRVTINRDEIILSALPKQLNNEQILLQNDDAIIQIDKQQLKLTLSNSTNIETEKSKAFVDADQLIFPLTIRYKQDGDKFKPLGMAHYKKLSDFFIDAKIPLPQKEKIPLLINGNGEIIWVIGLRQDDRYKVNTTTKKVAIFELLNN